MCGKWLVLRAVEDEEKASGGGNGAADRFMFGFEVRL